jgi:hypothetical protein
MANEDDNRQLFLQTEEITPILVLLEGASLFVALFIAILGAAGFLADRLYGPKGTP